jgi:AcrR family transcriptional regulator
MTKVTQRLTREDWILAGFRALTAGGVAAWRVEPVSRALGTTKGSFYWHFADPADWRTAMLTYWEDVAYLRVIADLEMLPKGAARLAALTSRAVTGVRDPSHGGLAAEPALRDWARYAPDVAQTVARVDAGRMAFLAACLADMRGDGQDASVAGRAVYAAYLGLQSLQGSGPDDAAALMALITALGRGETDQQT